MVYTHSAPQAYGVMGWGSARVLSPGGTAVSKATPAHRGGTPACASWARAQYKAAGDETMRSTGSPRCHWGSTGRDTFSCAAQRTCQDGRPRTRVAGGGGLLAGLLAPLVVVVGAVCARCSRPGGKAREPFAELTASWWARARNLLVTGTCCRAAPGLGARFPGPQDAPGAVRGAPGCTEGPSRGKPPVCSATAPSAKGALRVQRPGWPLLSAGNGGHRTEPFNRPPTHQRQENPNRKNEIR